MCILVVVVIVDIGIISYTYVCIYKCMHACMHVLSCRHECMCVCVCVCVCVYLCAFVFIRVHLRMRTCEQSEDEISPAGVSVSCQLYGAWNSPWYSGFFEGAEESPYSESVKRGYEV